MSYMVARRRERRGRDSFGRRRRCVEGRRGRCVGVGRGGWLLGVGQRGCVGQCSLGQSGFRRAFSGLLDFGLLGLGRLGFGPLGFGLLGLGRLGLGRLGLGPGRRGDDEGVGAAILVLVASLERFFVRAEVVDIRDEVVVVVRIPCSRLRPRSRRSLRGDAGMRRPRRRCRRRRCRRSAAPTRRRRSPAPRASPRPR